MLLFSLGAVQHSHASASTRSPKENAEDGLARHGGSLGVSVAWYWYMKKEHNASPGRLLRLVCTVALRGRERST